tara:strand:+ start:2562 stop:3878 length:1317 start_codon:yes stop_codon:yes gene_type:complete
MKLKKLNKNLLKKSFNLFKTKNFQVGIIGLGYVGLPLAKAFSENNIKTIGFDIDKKKIKLLRKKKSYIKHFSNEMVRKMVKKNFECEFKFNRINEVDVIILCLPTPLKKDKSPDITYISKTINSILKFLKPYQVLSLESTTYPGTCEDLIVPKLKNKFNLGKNFYLIYSPEREDPGNKSFNIKNIPKVIGGFSKNCLKIGSLIYSKIVKKTIPVSSLQTAELVKIFENIYRSVNISLVNELKMLSSKMSIDVYEIINAAKTKPFGFQAFYPGPGYGGHCIPIDPFLLTWKAKQYNFKTRFVELSGKINAKITENISKKISKIIKKKSEQKVLIIGVAYKKNIDDYRESPALKIFQYLNKSKIKFSYYDPYVSEVNSNQYLLRKRSLTSYKNNLKKYELVVILTNHDDIDYKKIQKNAKKVIDTRGVYSLNKYKNVLSL